MNYKTMRKTTTTGKLTTHAPGENNNVKRANNKVYLSLRVAHVDIRAQFFPDFFFCFRSTFRILFQSNVSMKMQRKFRCLGIADRPFYFFVVCPAKADSMLLFLLSFYIYVYFCVRPSSHSTRKNNRKYRKFMISYTRHSQFVHPTCH